LLLLARIFPSKLGLDSVTLLPQVHASYKETLLIVHPNKNNRVVVEGESQAFQKFKEAFKVFKDAHDAEADNPRPINQRSRAAASSASAAAPGPAAAPGFAPQPQSHGPAQGSFAASDNNNFSHCIIAEHNNSFHWHNWDAGLQFFSDKEISEKLFELRDFTFTSALPMGKDRTKFSSCMKKVLVLADIFQDSIRVRDTLRHLARMLPTLLLSHGFKPIQTRCNCLLKGDLEWLWAFCTKLGRARQTRLAANPHTGKACTATQLDALAQKLARAGSYSKSCQVVCSDSTTSLGSHTLAKLQAKNPQGSVDFDKKIGPPLRIWMLYARKMIGCMSQKNTFLLTTYVNILPVLPH